MYFIIILARFPPAGCTNSGQSRSLVKRHRARVSFVLKVLYIPARALEKRSTARRRCMLSYSGTITFDKQGFNANSLSEYPRYLAQSSPVCELVRTCHPKPVPFLFFCVILRLGAGVPPHACKRVHHATSEHPRPDFFTNRFLQNPADNETTIIHTFPDCACLRGQWNLLPVTNR